MAQPRRRRLRRPTSLAVRGRKLAAPSSRAASRWRWCASLWPFLRAPSAPSRAAGSRAAGELTAPRGASGCPRRRRRTSRCGTTSTCTRGRGSTRTLDSFTISTRSLSARWTSTRCSQGSPTTGSWRTPWGPRGSGPSGGPYPSTTAASRRRTVTRRRSTSSMVPRETTTRWTSWTSAATRWASGPSSSAASWEPCASWTRARPTGRCSSSTPGRGPSPTRGPSRTSRQWCPGASRRCSGGWRTSSTARGRTPPRCTTRCTTPSGPKLWSSEITLPGAVS
mmetsp:Transcript_61657/g.141057  ORF Transcript_61657/g.141057 Transcript_61657/m.141057 type:complete len:280 (+) Transcript_61657:245-1084(+)